MGLVQFLSLADCECLNSEEYYASLQPEDTVTASAGDFVNMACSTNLPATYPSQWVINGYTYQITRLPPAFIPNGLNLAFTFKTTVMVRCIFKIPLSGTVADICSNIATIVPIESVQLQSCG